MTSLLASKQSRRRGIVFTVLLAVTLLLMAFSSNPYLQEAQRGLSFALRPFQGAIAEVADWVAGVAGAVSEIDQLRTENTALRAENDRLENENARLDALRAENDELTALLQLQGGIDHETVATRVIGRESLDNRQLVVLDKGSDDGIAEGDAVIVQGGALVGRVTTIGPSFAKVTLISDASSTVVGQLVGSGATGDVVGQAGGVLVMRNIDATTTIGLEEEVFTAGIELASGVRSPYPRGLLLGSVVDVQRSANDVVQTAFLDPAADLGSFEMALVVTDYEGGLPPAELQPVPCGTEGTIPDGEVPCYTPLPAPTPTKSP